MFSIYDAFNSLDANSNGSITIDEFKDKMTAYGVFTNNVDL
jgi:Ca2+-binding EF-hand superfamily protein